MAPGISVDNFQQNPERGYRALAQSYGTLLAAFDAGYGLELSGNNILSWRPKYVTPPSAGVTTDALQDLYTLVQATTSNQPQYVANRGDGIPEVAFNGTSHKLTSAGLGAAFNVTSCGVALHGKLASSTAGGRIVQVSRADETYQTLYIVSTISGANTNFEAGVRNAGAWGTGNTVTAASTSTLRFTYSVDRSSGGSTWYADANGTTSSTTLATTVSAPTIFSLGCGSGVCFGGTITAMWLYASPVSTLMASGMRSLYPNL